MKKLFPSKLFVLGILSLVAFMAFAKKDKVVQIFRNGEVIQEYAVSEIDYIEVNDRISDETDPIIGHDSISIDTDSINGHGYVDLGLPSGLKWATCNIGASAPTEYGDYFAWGETAPKATYTDDNSLTFFKPWDDISGDPIYDAARVNWGGTWRMPNRTEVEELLKKCDWKWIWPDENDITGFKITGPNGKSIFLPAAGYYTDAGVGHNPILAPILVGEVGRYWSSTPPNMQSAFTIYFSQPATLQSNGAHYLSYYSRSDGQSVRPVSD